MTDAEAAAVTASRTGQISEAEIARKAFELFCARGGQHGRDLEDWLRAERELLATTTARSGRRTVRKAATN